MDTENNFRRKEEKNMRTLEIEGVTFEVEKDTTTLLNPWHGFLHITDAYDRPSETKKAIYDDWERYFYMSDTMRVHEFGVISHNCFKFTIGAVVEIDGTMYNVTITDCHNRISKVIKD